MALRKLGRPLKILKVMNAPLVRCLTTLDILREFADVLSFLTESRKLNNNQPKKEPNQMNKLLLSYIAGLVIGAGSVLAIVEIVFTR